MYYSEYLRNKKRSASQIISPPTGRSSSLWTQMRRYANSGSASICCADTIKAPTELPATCCDRPVLYPRGFYGPVKPDCCPVNGPPIGPTCCLPSPPSPPPAPCCGGTINFDDFNQNSQFILPPNITEFTFVSITPDCSLMSWTYLENGNPITNISGVSFVQADFSFFASPNIVIVNNSDHAVTATDTSSGYSFTLGPCGAVPADAAASVARNN